MVRHPKRSDNKAPNNALATTSSSIIIGCRRDLLVFTHLLCAVIMFLACRHWPDFLLPTNTAENTSWKSNDTVSHHDDSSHSGTIRGSTTTETGSAQNNSASTATLAQNSVVATSTIATKSGSPNRPGYESTRESVLDFTAPPLFPNGTVQHIYWMHVQKTGTSFFNTIYFQFCPEVLQGERDHAASLGRPLNRGHFVDMWLIKNYPPKQWCSVAFYNMPIPGFHHPFSPHPDEEFFSMTMFRHPIERLWSAYRFGRHGSAVKDPTNTTFAEYVREFNIPNCQLKMVLGYQCFRQQPGELERIGKLDVDLAIARVTDQHFFFGITERWAESICLFHRWFGGNVIPDVEFFNNRKGEPAAEPGNYHKEVPMHDELRWYEAILPVFEERLKAANCLGYKPGEDRRLRR